MISVLLNIFPDEGNESRVQAAIALVKSQGGHITCVQAVSTGSIPVADPASAATEAETLLELERVAREFQDTVEAMLAKADVGWSWLRFFGDPGAIVVERARLADVVILSSQDSVPSVSSVALHSRTPVLAVPVSNPNFIPDRSALIAWNGSEPAADAVHGAMPMLDFMEPVQILSVDHDSEEFPASLVQQYLHHHQIRSDVHWRNAEDRKSIADTIINVSEELGCGLIVGGAFSHSRLREMVLGGVTRELLERSPVPLLLAH